MSQEGICLSIAYNYGSLSRQAESHSAFISVRKPKATHSRAEGAVTTPLLFNLLTNICGSFDKDFELILLLVGVGPIRSLILQIPPYRFGFLAVLRTDCDSSLQAFSQSVS